MGRKYIAGVRQTHIEIISFSHWFCDLSRISCPQGCHLQGKLRCATRRPSLRPRILRHRSFSPAWHRLSRSPPRWRRRRVKEARRQAKKAPTSRGSTRMALPATTVQDAELVRFAPLIATDRLDAELWFRSFLLGPLNPRCLRAHVFEAAHVPRCGGFLSAGAQPLSPYPGGQPLCLL